MPKQNDSTSGLVSACLDCHAGVLQAGGLAEMAFSCFVRLEVYDQGASVAGVWLGLSPWGTGGLSPVLAWQQTSLFPFL